MRVCVRVRRSDESVKHIHVRMCACICVCERVCICVRVYVYVCMYVCVYVRCSDENPFNKECFERSRLSLHPSLAGLFLQVTFDIYGSLLEVTFTVLLSSALAHLFILLSQVSLLYVTFDTYGSLLEVTFHMYTRVIECSCSSLHPALAGVSFIGHF